ncbi:MAG: hypothetical protein U5R48_10415 [Gammaproteobacteria bacterium]|nr:hypothetical protein [Gammaproteobacteria bacterium]
MFSNRGSPQPCPADRLHGSRYLQALLTSTALVSAGAASFEATAEEAMEQADQSRAIEEIVVRGVACRFRPEEQNTATGLNMALIDTPQAVTVLTPEMMNTINADSAYEATDLVPHLTSVSIA